MVQRYSGRRLGGRPDLNSGRTKGVREARDRLEAQRARERAAQSRMEELAERGRRGSVVLDEAMANPYDRLRMDLRDRVTGPMSGKSAAAERLREALNRTAVNEAPAWLQSALNPSEETLRTQRFIRSHRTLWEKSMWASVVGTQSTTRGPVQTPRRLHQALTGGSFFQRLLGGSKAEAENERLARRIYGERERIFRAADMIDYEGNLTGRVVGGPMFPQKLMSIFPNRLQHTLKLMFDYGHMPTVLSSMAPWSSLMGAAGASAILAGGASAGPIGALAAVPVASILLLGDVMTALYPAMRSFKFVNKLDTEKTGQRVVNTLMAGLAKSYQQSGQALEEHVVRSLGRDVANRSTLRSIGKILTGRIGVGEAGFGLRAAISELGLTSSVMWRDVAPLLGIAGTALSFASPALGLANVVAPANMLPFFAGVVGKTMLGATIGMHSADYGPLRGINAFMRRAQREQMREQIRVATQQEFRQRAFANLVKFTRGKEGGLVYGTREYYNALNILDYEVGSVLGERYVRRTGLAFAKAAPQEQARMVRELFARKGNLSKQQLRQLAADLTFRTRLFEGGSTFMMAIRSAINPYTAGSAIFSRGAARAVMSQLSKEQIEYMNSFWVRAGARFTNIKRAFKTISAVGFTPAGHHPEPTLRDIFKYRQMKREYESLVAKFGKGSRQVEELGKALEVLEGPISKVGLKMPLLFGIGNLALMGHMFYSDYQEGRPLNYTLMSATSFEAAFLLGHAKFIGVAGITGMNLGAIAGDAAFSLGKFTGRLAFGGARTGAKAGLGIAKVLIPGQKVPGMITNAQSFVGKMLSRVAATGLPTTTAGYIRAGMALGGTLIGGAIGLIGYLMLPEMPRIIHEMAYERGKEDRLREAMAMDLRGQNMPEIIHNQFAMQTLATERQRAAYFAKQAGMNYRASLGDEAYLYHSTM